MRTKKNQSNGSAGKTVKAILALHRMRRQLVKFRTAQINGLRGLSTAMQAGGQRARTSVRAARRRA